LQKGYGFTNFVNNIFRNSEEEDPLLFVMVNNGKIAAMPKNLYILYKKKT